MEPREPRDYEGHAQRVANELGLTVKAAFKGDTCPLWERPCKHQHGDRYRVTLRKQYTPDTCPGKPCGSGCDHANSISFDYWNSMHDKAEGKRPTVYNILSTVSSEASYPTDPDEVAAECGEMKPSQAIRIAKFAAKLQAFFTQAELEKLAEIQ